MNVVAATSSETNEPLLCLRGFGVDDLTEILSRLFVQGPTMLRLQRSQSVLHEMVSKVDLAARGELHSLEQRMYAARENLAARATADEELRRLDTVPAAVAGLIEAAGQDLRLVRGSAIRRLGTTLRDTVSHRAAAAREMLLAQPRLKRHEHVW
jgi:hypothetical protein